MKKFVIPVLLGLVVCLLPLTASAKQICWTDGTSFFVLNGGKTNVKAFAGRFVSPVLGCHGLLTGSIMNTSPGVETVSIEGNLPAPCVNFAVFGTTADPALNFTGTFDNLENATADGTSPFTIVNCSTVPTSPVPPPSDASRLPNKSVAGYNPAQADAQN